LSGVSVMAGRKEFEAYREAKQAEGERRREPARAERDPEWNSQDHLDLTRASDKPSKTGAAKDAIGQAERGAIDQKTTSKGYTETK
jgi:hypothetical protein